MHCTHGGLGLSVASDRSGSELPVDDMPSTEGHERIALEVGLVRWNRPRFSHERDAIRVAWQAVEFRPVEAGKGLQLVQCAGLLERFGIQLDGRMCRVAAGAAAGRFLGATRMRG